MFSSIFWNFFETFLGFREIVSRSHFFDRMGPAVAKQEILKGSGYKSQKPPKDWYILVISNI